MREYEEHINRIIESIPNECNEIAQDAALTELLITNQRILEHANIIKSAIANRKIKEGIGGILLLCAKLEEVNSLLNQIRRGYNL